MRGRLDQGGAERLHNPGAAGYGDATNLLRALIDSGVEGVVFGSIRDPEAVALAKAAGEGATVRGLALGGKLDAALGGAPIVLDEAEVVRLTDGGFVHTGPMFTGVRASLGECAVLRVVGGRVTVLVASENVQMLDLAMLECNGVDPRRAAVVAVKSMQHFRGAFGPLASRVLLCDCGGLVSYLNLPKLPWRNVRRPMYPIDADAVW